MKALVVLGTVLMLAANLGAAETRLPERVLCFWLL
jgi:hypothetical protein